MKSTLPHLAASPEALDAAFESFWKAKDPTRTGAAIQRIEALEPPWKEIYIRLRAGRPYSADEPTGLFHRTREIPFYYTVLVPQTYDPTRRYPVTFVLHGSVSRPQWDLRDTWWSAYDPSTHPDRIAVYPAAWNEAMWWEGNQVLNLEAILKQLKRHYNVDENRVSMTGISDGGTGAYFFAMRAPTPWASFLPLISHPLVLANRELRVDGQIHAPNLANRPLFVVNAGQDSLYPSARIRPYIEFFKRAGARIEFVDKPEASHGMDWWSEENEHITTFLQGHPRNPLPDHIVWETERTDRYNRCDWLLITELGTVHRESDLEDINSLDGTSLSPPIFPRDEPSGRVELERQGHRVFVKTRGVKRFRLLLSPDQFDLTKPVTVTVNGRTAYRGEVEPSAQTLLRWAAEDQDRTALFAAQLDVNVPDP